VVEAAVSPGGLRPRLVTVWLALAALVAAIVAIEHADLVRPRPGGDGRADPHLLLPVPVDHLGAIEVAHAGRLHRFERDAAGAWFYHGVHTGSEGVHAHTSDPALAARIERAVAAFGRTRIERQFALGASAGDYGVAVPETLILVYRPHDPQPLVQYAVGDVAPDTFSRYVQVVGSSAVVTIPNYQIDNLLALIQSVGGPSDQDRAPRARAPARRDGSAQPGPRGGLRHGVVARAHDAGHGRGSEPDGGRRPRPARGRRRGRRADLALLPPGPHEPRPLDRVAARPDALPGSSSFADRAWERGRDRASRP